MTVDDRIPEPRHPDVYRIGFVCLGNICRSPMAAVILRDRLRKLGLDDDVLVESRGTGDWHVGNPMDRRAASTLAAAGYGEDDHRAQQLAPRFLADHDLVLVMDEANLRETQDLAPDEDTASRVRMFRDFDPRAVAGDREVPDPYYGGEEGFNLVLAMIERTADELAESLLEQFRPA